MSKYSYFPTFKALLWRDILVYNQRLKDRLIDSVIWAVTVTAVAYYLLPLFGTSQKFGKFIVIGNMAIWSLLEMQTLMTTLTIDIAGPQSISYFLTLPIPQSMVFVKEGVANAYKSFACSLPVLPVGLFVIQDVSFLTISGLLQTLGMHMIGCLAFGFAAVALGSLIHNIERLSSVRARFLFPLWFFGGYQYTWHMLQQVLPWAAYLNLLNPTVYILEGLRGPIFPNQLFLPFWLCVSMTLLFSALFCFIGVKNFTKRLDCIKGF